MIFISIKYSEIYYLEINKNKFYKQNQIYLETLNKLKLTLFLTFLKYSLIFS
jgi:hypothetical protein